jgi:hypothetical protein
VKTRPIAQRPVAQAGTRHRSVLTAPMARCVSRACSTTPRCSPHPAQSRGCSSTRRAARSFARAGSLAAKATCSRTTIALARRATPTRRPSSFSRKDSTAARAASNPWAVLVWSRPQAPRSSRRLQPNRSILRFCGHGYHYYSDNSSRRRTGFSRCERRRPTSRSGFSSRSTPRGLVSASPSSTARRTDAC